MIQSPTIKYGIIAGVAIQGYMLLFYLIDPPLMLNQVVYLSGTLIFLLCMYLAVQAKKKQSDGAINFHIALRTAFGVYVIADILFFLFYYLMFNVVDPNLENELRAIYVEFYESVKASGQSYYEDRNIEEWITAAKEDNYNFTWANLFRQLPMSVIFGFGLSLLIGGITARR